VDVASGGGGQHGRISQMQGRALSTSRSHGVLWAALRCPPFATVFGGYLVSAVGDGMAIVAIPWLAILLAHGRHAGLLVGAAVAAYTLPGVVAGFGLGRLFSRWDGRLLILAEAALRAICLATVAGFSLVGLLVPWDYVALLGVSSLLGLAVTTGELVSVTELLPPEQHVAGNSLLTVTSFGTTMVGPALAGVLVVSVGPGVVIGIDAGTYVALIVAAAVSRHLRRPPRVAGGGNLSMVGALRALAQQPAVLGISLLCVVFFGLYGPVEVALPLYVSRVLHTSAAVLGGGWAAFAVGATMGVLGAPLVERFGLWRVALVSMAGWGVCLLPFGFLDSSLVAFAALAAGGLLYGPFVPLKRAVIQRSSPPGRLAAIAAASAMLTTPASPLGTALGGPLVAAVGPSLTLLTSGLATVVAALAATQILLMSRRRGRGQAAPASAAPNRPSSSVYQ
jgi:MFS family permease